jgi:hypothetical protein
MLFAKLSGIYPPLNNETLTGLLGDILEIDGFETIYVRIFYDDGGELLSTIARYVHRHGEKVWIMRGKYKLIIPDSQVKYWTYLEKKEV